MLEFKQCKRCLMDNASDKFIYFDTDGYCNYCNYAISIKSEKYFPDKNGETKFEELIKYLKEENKNKEYDCIMGLSGGLDSSYLAYLCAQKGLRILAVHVDDGYDTELAKNNIDKLAKKAEINLITIKPDSEQFNDLTKAFMRAGVPNLAIPQDNILFACLYHFAREKKIKHFLSGSNYALECIIQRGNTHNAYDVIHIKDIHKKFGEKKIDKLEFISAIQKDIEQYLLRVETITPLDYIDYNKEKAIKDLADYCGFEYYGSKHLENSLTKFVQLYWFTKKFGVDKRKSHLSSMIISGQMTKDDAILELNKLLYDEIEMREEISEIIKKLGLSQEEFNNIMKGVAKQHDEYKISLYMRFRNKIALLKRKIKLKERISS